MPQHESDPAEADHTEKVLDLPLVAPDQSADLCNLTQQHGDCKIFLSLFQVAKRNPSRFKNVALNKF
jgi:hypothetical protein